MSTLMDFVRETAPNEKPLKTARDEELAEVLAMQGSVRGVLRHYKVNRKRGGNSNHLYALVNAYKPISQERAKAFRGRVHFKILEMEAELREKRSRLISQAAEVYDEAMEPKQRKKKPRIAADIAKHTLDASKFFGSSVDGEGKPQSKLDLSQLNDKELKVVIKALEIVRKCED